MAGERNAARSSRNGTPFAQREARVRSEPGDYVVPETDETHVSDSRRAVAITCLPAHPFRGLVMDDPTSQTTEIEADEPRSTAQVVESLLQNAAEAVTRAAELQRSRLAKI